LKYIESSQVKESDELLVEILDVVILGSDVPQQAVPKVPERRRRIV